MSVSSNIGRQVQTTYQDYKKIKSFNDVGFFLQNYVNEGGVITKNVKRDEMIDVTDISAALANQVMAREGTSFITTIPNTTYYLDFHEDGDWRWGTGHPTGVYLTIAEVQTDENGNVKTIIDKRGEVGGFRLKSEYGLEDYATNERLDDEISTVDNSLNQVTMQLVETETDINAVGVSIENYRDYVVGDDWSPALQQMADEGKVILIPSRSTYVFSQTILVTNNFSIVGQHTDTSILQYTGTGSAFAVKNPETTKQRLTFQSLRLESTHPNKADVGINLSSVDHGLVVDCFISGFKRGILLQDVSGRCYYNYIGNARLSSCTTAIHITGNKPNVNTIEGCRISGGTNGIFVEIDRNAGLGPVNTLKFLNNNFFNLTYGIRMQYINSSIITGSRFETVDYCIYYDKTNGALHRYLQIGSNHYGASTTAWLGEPAWANCTVIEAGDTTGWGSSRRVNFPDGVHITDDKDATSLANGGSGTFAGGMAVGKSMFLGGNMTIVHDTAPYVNKVIGHQGSSLSVIWSSTAMVEHTKSYLEFKADTDSMVVVELNWVGSQGNADNRIVGISKKWMAGLAPSSLYQVQTQTGFRYGIPDDKAFLEHVGSHTFRLVIENTANDLLVRQWSSSCWEVKVVCTKEISLTSWRNSVSV